jgi:hypothetical protein
MVSRGHHCDFIAGLITPQSGGLRGHALRHFPGHGVEYLPRFNSAGDQRAHPAHRGLLGGEPAVLGVRRDIPGKLIELADRRFVGVE